MTSTSTALEVSLTGLVQGVGMRPMIYRLSQSNGLTGEVFNCGGEVTIRWFGERSAIQRALHELRDHPPLGAQIAGIATRDLNTSGAPHKFAVCPSLSEKKAVQLMPDRALCERCRSELFDPADRRYHYPFTHCTECGPRYTVLETLPWDRANTSLAEFPLCKCCETEYNNPEDRRFHAEPIACPACGPAISYRSPAGDTFSAESAMSSAIAALNAGEIITLQGTGCFQLACKANNDLAISRLRALKNRPHKPLAILCASLAQAQSIAHISQQEAEALRSPAAPIVLVQACKDHTLNTKLAPDMPRLGIMLAHSPLHHVLLEGLDHPIVLTSANFPGRPSLIDAAQAIEFANQQIIGILWHNRTIKQRADDSLVQLVANTLQPLRRARGYAPAPLPLPPGFDGQARVLALGGHEKNTFCLLGGQAVLSPWVGDLDSPALRQDWTALIEQLSTLQGFTPSQLACDQHPEYFSTRHAQTLAEASGLQVQSIWHHHAHAASCLADNLRPLSAAPILCVCFDGSGLGDDGTLWGGEFLLADYRRYRRLGHLQTFPLVGGELAARQPWRNLFAQLHSHQLDQVACGFNALTDKPLASLSTQLQAGVNCPATSSIGRLFDAVAAALNISDNHYEGQAAMQLEALASVSRCDSTYSLPVVALDSGLSLSTAELWPSIRQDLQAGASREDIARRFHKGLAQSIAAIATALYAQEDEWTEQTVALTGGVFQNITLTNLTEQALREKGFQVLLHRQVPANDGGLALGQACVAAARSQLAKETT